MSFQIYKNILLQAIALKAFKVNNSVITWNMPINAGIDNHLQYHKTLEEIKIYLYKWISRYLLKTLLEKI